jgi:hypothetical protein
MDEILNDEEVLLKFKNKLRWADILGSAFLFAFAYLFLYILYDLATAITAAHYFLVPTLFFDTIGFENTTAWYPRAVKITFSIGLVVMLVTGIGFYVAYLRVKTAAIPLRLMLLWLSFLSFTIISQRAIGAFFASGFPFRSLDALGLELGIVAAYFYMTTAGKVAMALLGFLLSVTIGVLYAKPLLQTATSVYQIDIPQYRQRFLWHHLILPPVIGSVIITLSIFPMNIIPNFMTFTSTSIGVLSIWFFAMRSTQLIRRQTVSKYWSVFGVLMFLLIISLVHTVLKQGIPIPYPGF